MPNTLKEAIEAAGGPTKVAAICGFTGPRAIHKWIANGALPRTEYTGETNYSELIAKASKGKFTARQLRDRFRPESKSA